MRTSGHCLPNVCDYLLWYAKNRERVKYRQLFLEKATDGGAERVHSIEIDRMERSDAVDR